MTKTTLSPSHIHLLPTLIFLLFALSLDGNAQDSDPNQEHNILLLLKQNWSNPPSLSHWKPSSDHCTWSEITCTNGSVTKLEIKNRTIAGTIPAFICDLSNLTYLNLQVNSFSGYFPDILYGCSNLEHLDLSNNSFFGAIPDDINRLSPRLQYIDLGSNMFSGDIPSAIGRLSSLKTLYLYDNLFNGSFPQDIGNLSNLEELNLNSNGFLPQRIPSSFTQLKKLKNFWMTGTNMIGEIPQSIGNMSALEFLDLSDNGLNGSIPDGLLLLDNLTNLFLYKNGLSGSIPRRIECLNMQVLDLSANNLTGTIPDDFGKLTNLTGLALFFNQLSGEIPTSIGRLPGLVDFGLFSNKMSGELPPDFGRYSKLRTFQVSENQFVGKLPEYLCANKVLIGVVAFKNNLSGGVPKSLGDCNSLTVVFLHENSLSGEIPDGIWTSSNLFQLKLNDNHFTGKLPSTIGPQLSLLDVENNQFSGPIPADISSWENLREFKASNNLLSGVIPQELTGLPLLAILSLDGNGLSGYLPSNIISWKSMTLLNLSGNQLSGEIPKSIGFLPQLLDLDLSRNKFSGEIPPEIGRLKLTSLNLSSNQLFGEIPDEFEIAAFDSSFLNNAGLCANNPSLGLSRCNSQAKKSKTISSHFVAAVSSVAALTLLVAILYAFFVIRSYRKRKHISNPTWKLTSFQRLSFTERSILSSLTDNNLIGSGGSGEVYRVPIRQSREYVAVKKIWDTMKLNQKLEKEFLAEVEILGSIRHSNIVKLLCCISSEESKLLVYEYMENCSLDRWLHGKKRQYSFSGSVHHVVLDWPKRLQIAVGAAQGLFYMHHACSPPIIHRDVKSSNVLLDSEFNAKIADFGLARTLIKNSEPNTMSAVAGSIGYIAPEYAQTARVNEKIDVFSFGVVLLELVTGREAHNGDETTSLVEWTRRHIQEGKNLADALDEDIKEAQYMDEIDCVLKLGIICTGSVPSNRPNMRDVLQILLQCSQKSPPGEKKNINEYDIAPLLQNRNPERSLEHNDSLFASIV
ncbi:uncharacterized protein LOC142548419 [Primulina tabacum]|uniref:uncharacterized protein LOC142548419 n=1 Tax=Primulina tabacum TaxID=48773 RepID=UPI003F5A1DE0